jgi:hypothetical protein
MTSINKDSKYDLTTLIVGTERGFIYILEFESSEIKHKVFNCNGTPVQILSSGSIKQESLIIIANR